MAEIKTRDPRGLTDENYDEWFTGWVAWFLAFPDTVEFANWLRPDLQAFDDDYFAKYCAAMAAEDTQEAASAVWRTAVKALRELLIKLRISLPTLTPGDDSVLDTLKLRDKVSDDADKLVVYATLADNAWKPLSADPQYAPFAARLNEIAPMTADVNAKRSVMRQAILAYSTATDAKTAARDVCHTRERAVFNFFRGEGKPPEFWTSSVYGLGTGGEEEPSVPIVDWPGPGAFSGKYLGQKQVELIYGPVKDATHCDIEWKEKNAPNEDYVVLFNDITMDPKEITDMRQLSVDKGKYVYRLVPYKDEEMGLNAEIEVDVTD